MPVKPVLGYRWEFMRHRGWLLSAGSLLVTGRLHDSDNFLRYHTHRGQEGTNQGPRLRLPSWWGPWGLCPHGKFSDFTLFHTWDTSRECTYPEGKSEVTNGTGLCGCHGQTLGQSLVWLDHQMPLWQGLDKDWFGGSLRSSFTTQQPLFLSSQEGTVITAVCKLGNWGPSESIVNLHSSPGNFPQEFRLLTTTLSLAQKKLLIL